MPTKNNVEPTTSATERLRALLDERGVEWHHTSGSLGVPYTWWYSPTMGEVDATEGEDGKLYMVLNLDLTPEQAVEATLGRGSCNETIINHHWRGCGSCGYIWEFMYGIGKCERPHYCPNCGRRCVG